MTKEELANRSINDTLIIDIREPDEIIYLPMFPGAVNISPHTIIEQARTGQLPKDKLIVTICRSGARCYPVNQLLHSLGYRVDLLEGGLVD